MTESGPDTTSPCIFPFIVGGITYNEFADFSDMHDDDYYDYYSYNAKNGKWCSTQVRCSSNFPGVLFATSTGWTKKKGVLKNLKSIRKGKNWCDSENSALMLQDRHQTCQN